MVTTHIKTWGSVCSLVVMVQSAHAEEAIDQYMAGLESAMDAVVAYVDVISDLQDEELSPAEAAERITEIAQQIVDAKEKLKSILPQLSEEEKEEINEAMEDDELRETLEELDEAVSTLREFLEKEYANEGLIDAAQRKFDAAYQ